MARGVLNGRARKPLRRSFVSCDKAMLQATAEMLETRRLLSTGTGITGFYYGNTSLTNYQFNRLDTQLNFPTGSFPTGSLAANNFSVHWDGLLTVPSNGVYTFYANVIGGERLWINGTQVINNWTQHSSEDTSTTVTVNAPVNVRMEYFSTSSTPAAILSWSSSAVTKAVIPTANEFPLTTGLGGYTQPVVSTTPSQVAGTLPVPWTANAISGQLPIAGTNENSSYTGPTDTSQGTFAVTGSGTFGTVTNDQLEFASQQLTGDFTITAQVDNMLTPAGGVPNNGALVGLMVRTDLSPSSPYLFTGYQPSGYVWEAHRQWVGETGIAAPDLAGTPGTFGYVKLVRAGDAVSAYYSPDGTNWTAGLSQQMIGATGSVYVGMAVDARSTSVICTGTFSNVSITSPAASNSTSVIGNSLAAANEHIIDGAYASYVDAAGHIYLNGRDEAKSVEILNTDGSLNSYGLKSHFTGASAITADANFVFAAQYKQGDGVAGVQRFDHLGNTTAGTLGLGSEILGGDTITGLAESPLTGLLYIAGNSMVYEFQPSNMSFTGRAFEVDNSAQMAFDSSGNLWIVQTANGSTAAQVEHVTIPTSGTISNVPTTTVTFTTGYSGLTVVPAGIAINSAGNIYVTDMGQLQQIHIFNPAGTHIGDFGSAYGVYGGSTPGVEQPLSFDYPLGVGFDSAGNIYVVNGGITQTTMAGVVQQNSDIIRKFTSAGVMLWERSAAVYQDVAGADPTDPTHVYMNQYAYGVNYSNSAPGSEQTLLGPMVEPFLHPDDPRIQPIGGTGGANSETKTNYNGIGNIVRYITIGGVTNKYLFEMNSGQSGPIMIYRFDPTHGPYATVFCGQIWTNLDNGYKKNYAWMDLNGDGTKEANEEQTATNWLSYVFGATVDANGDIWLVDSDQNLMFEYKPVSFSNGAVVYDLTQGKSWSVASDFTRACRVIYNVPTQTLFLSGYTTANNLDTDGFGLAGSTLFVYKGFVDTMTALPGSPTYSPTVFRTTDTNATRLKSIDVDPAGNYVFGALGVPAYGVNVINFKTQAITTLIPSPTGGAWTNYVDLSNSINVTQLNSGPYTGEYIIYVENVQDARSTMYRWNPALTVPKQGWTDGDIGSQATTGSGSYDINTGLWSLQAGGLGIGGTSDQFNLTSQLFNGDGSIVAQVQNLVGGNTLSQSGVMFRDSPAANAMYVAMMFDPASVNGAVNFSWRSMTGANANSTTYSFPAPTTTQWVKLSRQGNIFTGYFSSDGVTWTQAGSVQNIAIATDAVVGLGLTRTASSGLATSTFADVSINSALLDGDVGTPSKTGSGSFDSYQGTWTISGSGADIGGTTDEFNFASEAHIGDGTIIADLTSLKNPTTTLNAAAKAGVMFRAATGSSDLYAGVFVTPGNGLIFQWRNSSGTGSTSIAGIVSPMWVKLVRSINSFTAFFSSDGVTWSPIGSAVTVTLGTTAQAGLAVTAHDNTSLVTASFSNVSITGVATVITPNLTPDSTGSLNVPTGATLSVAPADVTADRTVLVVNSLTLAGTSNAWLAQLDLSSNDLIVHNGNLNLITNQIANGLRGPGISSSATATAPGHLTTLGVIQNSTTSGTALYANFDGVPTTSTDVLVKYTYYGDATLDGKVDGSDYTRIDNGFVNKLTGWNNGDFNYDNVINGSDYTLIDNAFNTQGASINQEIAAPAAEIQTANPARAIAVFNDSSNQDDAFTKRKPRRSIYFDIK